MTQHPIPTLPPAELRGYARGLRETAALLTGTGIGLHEAVSLLVIATREAWEREAALVEGFADRLEEVPAQPTPMTRERVASWVASFAPPIQAFGATPTCFATDAPCPPGCTADAGGICARQEAPTPAETAQQGLADAVAESLAPPDAHTERDATPTRAQRSDSPWTEERVALLRRLFPTVMSLDAMLGLLNARPGLPIPSANAIGIKARKLDLHRRGEAIPEEFAEAPASRTKQPQKAAPPKPSTSITPVVTAAFIPLTTEEMHNLREQFRKKEFGVTWLAEEYGMPPEEAQKIIEQLRAEAATRRAA